MFQELAKGLQQQESGGRVLDDDEEVWSMGVWVYGIIEIHNTV